jgi:osmotically-inducible protein OsmY
MQILIPLFLLTTILSACAPAGIISIPTSIADRRTTGVQVEDQAIELKALYEVQQLDDKFEASITSYNQNVLITGEAENEATKEKLQDIVAKIEEVKSIYNEVLVTKEMPFKEKVKSKAKDYGITTNIKARLFREETKSNLSPIHVKVITESQVVYLLGIVSLIESEEAERIAKSSKGVVKVKTFFEIDSKYEKN